MSTRIVVDSTCDLPPEVLERHSIEVIPVYLNIGDRSYQDGVELSRQQFYRNLPHYSDIPLTAAPSPHQFEVLYDRLLSEGATGILSIHLASSLSATVEMAAKAAERLPAGSVEVFDSGQLSLGAGFMAQAAAQGLAQGLSLKEVLDALRNQAQRTVVAAALDTLEYLRRSGRVSSLVAGLGGLLKVKPILKMHDGVAKSERVRTRKRAYERLARLVSRMAPLERLALVHTHSPERADDLSERLQGLHPEGAISSVDITPVIGAHIGPGAAGVVCVGTNPLTEADIRAIMG